MFLALGGATLAFVPGAPSFTVPPELALALFVAPILLDAAYDASPRDLKDNWAPVTGLVVVAVGLTTVAVAVVARTLMPAMPWAPAIALGAVVAPPDAAAATAVLRQLRPPHRHPDHPRRREPAERRQRPADLSPRGGCGRGQQLFHRRRGAGLLVRGGRQCDRRSGARMAHAACVRPCAACADRDHSSVRQHVRGLDIGGAIGLSGVLTMVCYAMTVARTAPERTPARIRIPSYAVWETVVFMLNVLAFVFIGLQLRPILASLEPAARGRYFAIAGAVLVTVIVVRIAWHMSFNAVIRWRERRFGFHPPRPMLRPTVGSGLVISWAGMRGIVSLAAALALPAAFPFRDLIVLTAFAVVLGTLTLQGLTLGPLLRALDLRDDDPVGHEVAAARERALRAGLAELEHDRSTVAEAVRQEFIAHLGSIDANPEDGEARRLAHRDLHRRALQAARQAVLAMRASEEIGDDAFHQMEEELDWIEMSGGGKEATIEETTDHG